MTQSYGKYWTSTMLNDLERLFAIPASNPDYMTVGEIAAYMHEVYHKTYPGVLNRNTVMSKIHSTGLNQKYPRKVNTAHNIGKQQSATKLTSPSGKRIANPSGRTGVTHNAALAKQQAQEWSEPPYHPTANNVPMLDAADNQCRWPVGTDAQGRTIACGCQKMRGSLVRPPQYCAEHMGQASGGPQVMRRAMPDRPPRRPAPRWA